MTDPLSPVMSPGNSAPFSPLDATGSGSSFSILFAKNPAMLDFSLAVSNGTCPDLQEPFTYCELGVGTGNSILNYAAAFPYAHFYGLDTQPDHLVGLMDRAKRGGVENLTAQAFGLEELPDLAAGLPPMDFVVVHRLYSRIPPEQQQQLRAFLGKILKLGGVAMVSYDAYPGWTVQESFRNLMNQIAPPGSGNPVERFTQVQHFFKNYLETDPLALTNDSQTKSFLEALVATPEGQKRHQAQEFLEEPLTPVYSVELHRAMQAEQLTFIGVNQPIIYHLPHLCFPEEALKYLAQRNDKRVGEILRDFFYFPTMRFDLFAKGNGLNTRRAVESRRKELHVLTLHESLGADSIPMEVGVPVGKINLRSEIHPPLYEAMAQEGLVSGERIRQMPFGEETMSDQNLRETLIIFVHMNLVTPALAPGKRLAERQASCYRFNETILNQMEATSNVVYLASPVTGAPVPLELDYALFLRAETRKLNPVSHALESLQHAGRPVLIQGEPAPDAKSARKALTENYERFKKQAQGLLWRLDLQPSAQAASSARRPGTGSGSGSGSGTGSPPKPSKSSTKSPTKSPGGSSNAMASSSAA